MQMYVNDDDREVKLPDENPTIGLLLCKSAKKTVVELTLPNVRQHPREGTGAQRVEDRRNGK